MINETNIENRIKTARENLTKYNLSVSHIKSKRRDNKGGLTVVYFKTDKRAKTLIISTAICSEKDQYNKKIGTTLAVERYISGQCIQVPKIAGHTPDSYIKYIFSYL